MPNKIRVLLLPVMDNARVEYMENTLEAKQKYVEGYIECLSVGDDVDIICNDEGKFTHRPNRPIFNGADCVYGPAIVARVDPATGNYIDLTDEDIAKYTEMFRVRALLRSFCA